MNKEIGGTPPAYLLVDSLYHRWISQLKLAKAQDLSPSSDSRHSQMVNEDLYELQKEASNLKLMVPNDPRLDIILSRDYMSHRVLGRKG